ncbi:RNA polymerase sigma factor [Williamsia deligens]|uniref:RNA polymerase sigma factor n=1 Tax=Williamsia deligens TaxID=321325 RepID=A0ABW3G4T1_9NOCA|nr:sigma-70 family RNA polymerase sigma factor [Williamsia deligens]
MAIGAEGAGDSRQFRGRLAEETDESLASSAAVGDRAAFEELVRRTLPLLLRYARRLTPDAQNAEDVVQETLVAAWKGLPKFTFQSSFRTWVFAIAHRKIIDLRRRRVEAPFDDEVMIALPDRRPGPADAALGRSLQEALEAELSALTPTSRAVWWLREMEGLSHPEIGEILSISPNSVRGHLQRTRARLAERLEPWRPRPARPDVSDEDVATAVEAGV